MLEHVLDAKFIYIMRYPIDRLVSHYMHAWLEASMEGDINQASQAGGQHCGFAVPVREAHAQPLVPRSAATATGYVGGSPLLFDEREKLGIEIKLASKPALPLPQAAFTGSMTKWERWRSHNRDNELRRNRSSEPLRSCHRSP
jgi:hypothetical protein